MSLERSKLFGLAIALGVAASSIARADDGRPSRASLSAMGLGGMAVLSDDEAMSIRGQGYRGTSSIVRVSGSSHADYETRDGDAHTQNTYFAEGKHAAKGDNLSYAGEIHISTKPGHGGGHGDGGYGGGPRRSKPGGGYGGGHGGGYGGGKISIKATIVFAGGSSSAWAF